jgi:hypothetical protein
MNKNDLIKDLKELKTGVLSSTLIGLSEERVKETSLADVLNQYNDNRFVEPSEIDGKEIIKISNIIANSFPDECRFVELAPVLPFGSHALLTKINQKTILTTNRNTEVVADGVIGLALEASSKYINNQGLETTDYANLHRETRAQQHSQPGFTAHYHALSYNSSAKAKNYEVFETSYFEKHIKQYLNILETLNKQNYETTEVNVYLSNIRVLDLIIKYLSLDQKTIQRNTQTPDFSLFEHFKVDIPDILSFEEMGHFIEILPEKYIFIKRPLAYMLRVFAQGIDNIKNDEELNIPVNFFFDLNRHAGIGYYQDLCVKITAKNHQNEIFPLIDIGTTDWIAKLTNDSSIRLITGGMGTEIFAKKFLRK